MDTAPVNFHRVFSLTLRAYINFVSLQFKFTAITTLAFHAHAVANIPCAFLARDRFYNFGQHAYQVTHLFKHINYRILYRNDLLKMCTNSTLPGNVARICAHTFHFEEDGLACTQAFTTP